MILLLVFFAWMATLFPIAGILKIGTFIADRIVVPSTVGTCIFGGRLLALWIDGRNDNENNPTTTRTPPPPPQSTMKRIPILKTIITLGSYVPNISFCQHTTEQPNGWTASPY
jgi:hypothetical protein